jgi:hypothetical protein
MGLVRLTEPKTGIFDPKTGTENRIPKNRKPTVQTASFLVFNNDYSTIIFLNFLQICD